MHSDKLHSATQIVCYFTIKIKLILYYIFFLLLSPFVKIYLDIGNFVSLCTDFGALNSEENFHFIKGKNLIVLLK